MAQGDVVFFDQFLQDESRGLHTLDGSTDTIKVGLTDGSTTPSATTADPRWGAGGSTDFSDEECAAGGNYSTGGATLTSFAATLNTGTLQYDSATNPSWSQDASNPTDATYGIIYNDTDTGKRAIGFVDLGGAYDMTTGDLAITWGTPLGTKNQA